MTDHTNETSCTKPFASQSVIPPMTVSHAQPAAAWNGASTVSTIGSHGHISVHPTRRSQPDSDHDRIPASDAHELVPTGLQRKFVRSRRRTGVGGC